MKKRNFLLSILITTLMLTANLSAQQLICRHGKCYVKLSRFTHIKTDLTPTIENFKNISLKKKNIESKNLNNQSDVIAFDHATYVMQKDEQLELIDNSGIRTIVFSPSTYIMTKAEAEVYNEQINREEEELSLHITKEDKQIEDKIIEKMTLPASEYYCANQKKAVYNKELKTYQCAI